MNKIIKEASCKARLDRHPCESRGPEPVECAGFRIKSGMTNGDFCQRLKVIAIVRLSLVAIIGVINLAPGSTDCFAATTLVRAAVDSPKSVWTPESYQAKTWLEQAGDFFGRSIHGIQVCQGDGEGENGDDTKGDDKDEDLGSGIDRLWDVVLYG